VARDYEPRCPAITSKGEPCQGYVHPGKEFCPAHDPARAEARKVAASKAGRVRTHTEFREVKAQLRELAEDGWKNYWPRKTGGDRGAHKRESEPPLQAAGACLRRARSTGWHQASLPPR
jgi:hypothetical protein